MGKIATEFEVKQKVNGYRTINEDKCCTKDRAVAIGANKMKLTQYEDDQLVQLDDIISGDMVHDYWWVYIQIQDYWMLEEEWDKFSSRELYEVSQTRNSGYANIIIYNEEYQTISDVPTKLMKFIQEYCTLITGVVILAYQVLHNYQNPKIK